MPLLPSPPRFLTLLYVIFTLALRLLLANNDLPAAAVDSATATATATATTRQLPNNQRTRSSQVDADSLPMVLLSIQENLHDISQRQKQDFSLLRVASDMDVISHRLKNVEEQIARAESYNKMRFEQLVESTMKSEFLIDQLTRRVEKSFQHMLNRLSAADSFPERIDDIHQANHATTRWTRLGFTNTIIAETDKIDSSSTTSSKTKTVPTSTSTSTSTSASQSQAVTDPPSPPPSSVSAYVNASAAATVTTTTATTQSSSIVDDFNQQQQQQQQQRDAGVLARNHAANDSNSHVLKASNDSRSSQSLSARISDQQLVVLSDVQQFVKNQADRVVSVMNEKHSQLERRMVFLKSSYDECVNLADQVYLKLSDKRFDATNYFDNVLETLVAHINSRNLQNARTLEMSVKNNLDAVLNLQRAFADNCRRLQLNEEQIEDKVIAVLQSLVDYIDNRTELAQRRRFLDRNYLIRELAERNLYYSAPASAETETESDIVEFEADQSQPIANMEQSRLIVHKMQLDDDDDDDESCGETVAHVSPSTWNVSFNHSGNVSKLIFLPETVPPNAGNTTKTSNTCAQSNACAGNTANAKSPTTAQRDQSMDVVLVDLYGTSTTGYSETEFEKNQLSDEKPVQDFLSSGERGNGFDVADNAHT